MKNLKEQLMEQAREKGICVAGYSAMRTGNIDELVDFYIESPDWCLERNYPTLPFLREHFANIEDKGVFVDTTFKGELLNDKQAYIFHNCKGTIKVGLNVEKANIPMLYLANGCRLKIQGVGEIVPRDKSDRTMVPIYTFGKNDVAAKDNKFVKFIHYKNDLL